MLSFAAVACICAKAVQVLNSPAVLRQLDGVSVRDASRPRRRRRAPRAPQPHRGRNLPLLRGDEACSAPAGGLLRAGRPEGRGVAVQRGPLARPHRRRRRLAARARLGHGAKPLRCAPAAAGERRAVRAPLPRRRGDPGVCDGLRRHPRRPRAARGRRGWGRGGRGTAAGLAAGSDAGRTGRMRPGDGPAPRAPGDGARGGRLSRGRQARRFGLRVAGPA